MEQVAQAAQAEAKELTALTDQTTSKVRKRYEEVYVGGICVATVGLQKVGQERKELAHYAHFHSVGMIDPSTGQPAIPRYGKLDQGYTCRICGKPIPYEERVRVVCAGKEDDECSEFKTASPKPEKAELEQGIYVEGKSGSPHPENVKEIFWVVPKRFKAKKEKSKDQANINAVWTLVQAQGLKCHYKNRQAVWTGPLMYVLWGDDELTERPDHAFPNAVKVDAIAGQFAQKDAAAALATV